MSRIREIRFSSGSLGGEVHPDPQFLIPIPVMP
jgi:hypothetical protein